MHSEIQSVKDECTSSLRPHTLVAYIRTLTLYICTLTLNVTPMHSEIHSHLKQYEWDTLDFEKTEGIIHCTISAFPHTLVA
jgi:hypothetical protein